MTLDQAYPAMRGNWISGSRAFQVAPEEWREILEGADAQEAERRLLALAGQCLDIAFRQRAFGIEKCPDIPQALKPTIPDEARPYYQVLEQNKHGHKARLMAEARGFSVHPCDWFPSAQASTDLLATYTPWYDWINAEISAAPMAQPLDDHTWNLFSDNERIERLKALRQTDPAGARQLLETYMVSMSANPRLKHLEVLRAMLSSDDESFLHHLSTDRSGKVKAEATRLLSRLGYACEASDDLKEFADFFSIKSTGFINKKTVVKPVPRKNTAQTSRFMQLGSQFTFTDLANALGMTTTELVEAWQSGDKDADGILVRMACDSATDEDAETLAMSVMTSDFSCAMTLISRTGPRFLRAALNRILSDPSLHAYLAFLEPDLVSWADINRTKLLKDVISQYSAGERPSLIDLAYLCTREAAGALLAAIIETGLHPKDHALTPLHYNLSLIPKEAL